MEKIEVKEILESTGGRLISGDKHAYFTSISTDTRTLKKGDLFIPLKGRNFDGHSFIPQAIQKGAKGIITCKKISGLNGEYVVIRVKDTLKALQDIAAAYRRRFQIPVIAVTGSNGKTTTKEILWSILSEKYSTLKNKGNYNNEVGVPLTLFGLCSSHKAAVLEIASNAPGEIRRLTEIVQPTIGVLTNIGLSHTEGLKDIHGVAREKFSLIRGLKKNATAVLNMDDQFMYEWAKKKHIKERLRVVAYGIERKGNVYATDVRLKERRSYFKLWIGNKSTEICFNLPGLFNVYNALAAGAGAHAMGMSLDSIKNGLEKARGIEMRMEIKKINDILLINDAYNSNPSSVKASISFIQHLKARRKILVLGDMCELGLLSVPAHREISRDIINGGIDIFYALGKFTSITAKGAGSEGIPAFHFLDRARLIKKLLKEIKGGDLILIKGSRAMKMEEVVNAISSALSSS